MPLRRKDVGVKKKTTKKKNKVEKIKLRLKKKKKTEETKDAEPVTVEGEIERERERKKKEEEDDDDDDEGEVKEAPNFFIAMRRAFGVEDEEADEARKMMETLGLSVDADLMKEVTAEVVGEQKTVVVDETTTAVDETMKVDDETMKVVDDEKKKVDDEKSALGFGVDAERKMEMEKKKLGERLAKTEKRKEWDDPIAALMDFIDRLEFYDGYAVQQLYAFSAKKFTSTALTSALTRFSQHFDDQCLLRDGRRADIFYLQGGNRVMPPMSRADLIILDQIENTLSPVTLHQLLPRRRRHILSFVLNDSSDSNQYYPGCLLSAEERAEQYREKGFDIQIDENAPKVKDITAYITNASMGAVLDADMRRHGGKVKVARRPVKEDEKEKEKSSSS